MPKKLNKDASTEEKIKQAAKRLFTQKGFAETKTREIAEESGINLALLNYYFRSKQGLYNIIMKENMASFKQGLAELFGDTQLDVYQKIEKLAHYYIDEFITNPDLPMFIVNTIYMAGNDSTILEEDETSASRKIFVNQIKELVAQRKIKPIHPAHILSNMMGLIIFPFVIGPLLKKRANINDKAFVEMMKERKKLIPVWIKSMLEN
ncbi:MAG: TetR/AcrR family transcriptional regulator [Chitinophagaceae bacterium]|nr:TetR/AcrR family transcriptional regulator [Chitinophagaceae bacterium]